MQCTQLAHGPVAGAQARRPLATRSHRGVSTRATSEKEKQESASAQEAGSRSNPEEVTKRYGLEAGLFSAFKNKKAGGVTAGELLKRYGGAYLITSITLSIISFAVCYVAVDSGVDVVSLLAKIGLQVGSDSAGEKAGTLALAYAAHKALSPVRFPPTVALTPVLASKFGMKGAKAAAEDESSSS